MIHTWLYSSRNGTHIVVQKLWWYTDCGKDSGDDTETVVQRVGWHTREVWWYGDTVMWYMHCNTGQVCWTVSTEGSEPFHRDYSWYVVYKEVISTIGAESEQSGWRYHQCQADYIFFSSFFLNISDIRIYNSRFIYFQRYDCDDDYNASVVSSSFALQMKKLCC